MSLSNYQTSNQDPNSSLSQSFLSSQQKQGPVQFPLQLSQNLSFNNSNTDYVLTIEASDERLTILVEDRFDIQMWRGDFTSKYIEEITKKTGKERSYSTFIQMLVGTIQAQKGFSQFYLDIMGYNELQLLKSQKSGDYQPPQQQKVQNTKKYLILTHVIQGTSSKVHYPLPLSQVETGAYSMDKETMLRMVKRMSQTLTEFKSMNNTQQPVGNNSFTQQSFFPRQTAKEFFSKENIIHPVVDENIQLKQKLQQLEQAKLSGGAVSLNNLHVEKNKLDQDFSSYQVITQKEIKKLRNHLSMIKKQIDDTKTEIQSERPQSAYSQLSTGGPPLIHNQTMTSNFNGSVSQSEVEDLRRQLAEISVELEETKEQYQKRMALQQKDLEVYYEELQSFRNEDKTLRVKVNQLENELEHQLKRLDIICKSKGLPRPQRKFSTSNSRQASSYVSPYRQQAGANSGQKRTLSNNNSAKRPSPFRNLNYTPPNKKMNGYSPSSNYSNGSGNNKFRQSPMNTGYSNNSMRQQQNSPGARSNASTGSKKGIIGTTQNRLYSPSGRVRNGSGGSTQMYGSNPTGTVNRVRREPAVGGGGGGANSRSNSRNRVSTPTSQKDTPSQRNTSQTRTTNIYGKTTTTQQKKPLNSSQNRQTSTYKNSSSTNIGSSNRPTLFNNQTNTQQQKSTLILDQSKPSQSIDEKIEKLQSLLKMAKNNNV